MVGILEIKLYTTWHKNNSGLIVKSKAREFNNGLLSVFDRKVSVSKFATILIQDHQ